MDKRAARPIKRFPAMANQNPRAPAKLKPSERAAAIRAFVLDNVGAHPDDIAAMVGDAFALTRAAVSLHLLRLTGEGVLEASGNTRQRRYRLAPAARASFEVRLDPDLSADAVFASRVAPVLDGGRASVVDLCRHAFAAALDNARDHSGADVAAIVVERTVAAVEIAVTDRGTGLFEKIRRHFGLPDARRAALELAKGRLTTDPLHHAGEGLFLATEMLDAIDIHCPNLSVARVRDATGGWSATAGFDGLTGVGTRLAMRVALDSGRTVAGVLASWHDGEGVRRRAHVPVGLARYPREPLVSRAQARAVLGRLESFPEATLDFEGVEAIGDDFAEEIFGVFARAHPGTAIVPARASEAVAATIDRIRTTRSGHRTG